MFFRKKKDPDDDGIEDSGDPDFDDIIIEHTKDRISQELSNFSSIETKAGTVLAANAYHCRLVKRSKNSEDVIKVLRKSSEILEKLAVSIEKKNP